MSGDRKPWGTYDRDGRLCSRHKTKVAAEGAAMRGERVRRIPEGQTYESIRKQKAAPRRYSAPRGGFDALAIALGAGSLLGRRR